MTTGEYVINWPKYFIQYQNIFKCKQTSIMNMIIMNDINCQKDFT